MWCRCGVIRTCGLRPSSVVIGGRFRVCRGQESGVEGWNKEEVCGGDPTTDNIHGHSKASRRKRCSRTEPHQHWCITASPCRLHLVWILLVHHYPFIRRAHPFVLSP